MTGSETWTFGLLALLAALICAGLIVVLQPLLARYALARPNARSSHRVPTPQGGGIAVMAALVVVVAGAALFAPEFVSVPKALGVILIAACGLAAVGVTDDIRPLEAMPRLILQAVAVAVVIAVLPAELRIFPALPWWAERALLLIGGVWFVNLVNFMDGIDWITVAEIVPISAALSAFGLLGALPPGATLISFVLCGAVLGFAPFNRPVARLFLGDVGSLPIGLLVAWLLAMLAGGGHLTAALLLPLYYVADATITVLRRLAKGEQITQAHRSHFYQHAIDNGLSVHQVVGSVFALNLILIALSLATLFAEQSYVLHGALLTAGVACVAVVLLAFARVTKKS